MPLRKRPSYRDGQHVPKADIYYPQLQHLHSRDPSSSSSAGFHSRDGSYEGSLDFEPPMPHYARDKPLPMSPFPHLIHRKVDYSKLPPPKLRYLPLVQAPAPLHHAASNTVAFPSEKKVLIADKRPHVPKTPEKYATPNRPPTTLQRQPAMRRTASSGNLVYSTMNTRAAASTGDLLRSSGRRDAPAAPRTVSPAQHKSKHRHRDPRNDSRSQQPDPLYYAAPSQPAGVLEVHHWKQAPAPAPHSRGYPPPELGPHGYVSHSRVVSTTEEDKPKEKAKAVIKQSLSPNVVMFNPADLNRKSWRPDDVVPDDFPILEPDLVVPPLLPSHVFSPFSTRDTKPRGPRDNKGRH